MTEGTLVEWLKQDGEEVRAGEILFTVETEKAVHEVESFEVGILHIPPDAPPPGVTVPVGTVLAYLIQAGEPVPSGHLRDGGTPPPAGTVQPVKVVQPTTSPEPAVAVDGHVPAISPRARRVAAELGVEWTNLRGSGRTGRIVEHDVRAAATKL